RQPRVRHPPADADHRGHGHRPGGLRRSRVQPRTGQTDQRLHRQADGGARAPRLRRHVAVGHQTGRMASFRSWRCARPARRIRSYPDLRNGSGDDMDMTDEADDKRPPGRPAEGLVPWPSAESAPAARSRRVSLVKLPRVKIISPVATARTASGVAKVALTAAGEVAAWSVYTAIGVTGTVVKGSRAGLPAREVLAEAEAEVRDAVRRALRLPAAPDAAAGLPTLREQ